MGECTGTVEVLLGVLRMNDRMIEAVAKDLTPDEWVKRLGNANHARWVLGHVAACRREALRSAGVVCPEEAWEKRFDIRTEPGDGQDMPEPAALLQDFLASGRRLQEAAGAADGQPAPTLVQALAFAAWHETHHAGQASLIRRSLGYAPLF